MDIAGVQKLPNANPALTTTAASNHALAGQGRTKLTTADATSAARSGRKRPYRSEACPSTGAHAASIPAMTRYVPATAAAPQPRSERRSGASTERLPNSNAGRRQSQTPIWIFRTPRARKSIRSDCGRSGAAAGVIHAAVARTSDRPATVPNAGPVPVYDAIAPSTGPKSAPTIAAPNADPISCPRRPGGDAATSQASAPVQENALETPCRNRARLSVQTESARPKATVVTASSDRPISTVGLTPSRAAAMPPGIAATSAPAGYIACRRPAPALPRSSSST